MILTTFKKRGWIFLCMFFLVGGSTFLEAAPRRFNRALSHFIMAGVYASLNQLDEAAQEYKKTLEYDYDSSVLHLQLASIYIKKGALDLATSELKLALKCNPQGLESHYLLALIYSLQNKNDLAKKTFEDFLKTAIELNPKDISLYQNLGQFYFQENRLKEAEEVYKNIIKQSPDNRQAHFMLAQIYMKQKLIDKAIEEFKYLLKLNPDDHVILNALGYLYAENGINLDEAEILIKKALEFEPDNGAYLDSLGWVYYQKSEIELAIKELEKAVKVCQDPIIYEHLGDAYLKAGEIIKAEEWWEKALKLSPSSLSLKQKLEDLKKIK